MLSTDFTRIYFNILSSIGYKYESDILAVNNRDNYNRKAYFIPDVTVSETRDIISIYCDLVTKGKIPEYSKDPRVNPELKFQIENAVFDVYGQDKGKISSTLWELFWITRTTTELQSNALLEPVKYANLRKPTEGTPEVYKDESGSEAVNDVLTWAKWLAIAGVVGIGAYFLFSVTTTYKALKNG